MNKRQLRKSLRRALNEMARGAKNRYGGYDYAEDKAQFNDDHSVLKDPLGVVSNSSDVSMDLWETLMDIFREAAAKGMDKESILGVAKDAARDYDA